MRKFSIGVTLVCLAALIGTAAACVKTEARNLVDGIGPASTAFAGIHGYAAELAGLPAAERAAHIEKVRPHLNQGVVYFLRGLGRIRPTEKVEKVELFFGSVEGTRVHDGQGREFKGYFKDELVARVHVSGGRKEDALVRCLNLWLELPAHVSKLQRLSSADFKETTEFTIRRGEGLVHHVDYAVAMTLAEKHNLPLYRGKYQIGISRITPDVARRLESRTDWQQVTVGVVEGDHFNLADGTFERRRR